MPIKLKNMKNIFENLAVKSSIMLFIIFVFASLTVYVGVSFFEGTFNINHFSEYSRELSVVFRVVLTIFLVLF